MAHPLRFGLKASGQGITIEELRAVWRIADEGGFDHVWDFDHLASIGPNGPGGPVYEGWALQAAMAEATKRARIGCMVTGNTYRHPVVLAMTVSSLDDMAPGRIILGLGSALPLRLSQMGIPYTPQEGHDRVSVAIDTRRYRDFAWLMVSRLFFLMAPVAIGTYAFNFIRYTFNYSEGKASLFSSALQATILVFAAVLCMTAGFLAERFGKKRLISAACLIGAVGSTLLIFAPSLPWILGFGLIVGISLGTFLSVDWAFMTDLIPKAEAGRYMGVSNIATASAGLIARPILGPIIDAFNNNRSSAVGYRVMFGIVTGFFLIALLTLQPVREIKVE